MNEILENLHNFGLLKKSWVGVRNQHFDTFKGSYSAHSKFNIQSNIPMCRLLKSYQNYDFIKVRNCKTYKNVRPNIEEIIFSSSITLRAWQFCHFCSTSHVSKTRASNAQLVTKLKRHVFLCN